MQEEAIVVNLDTQDRARCRFRPKEMTISKQNAWTASQVKGANVPTLEFGGGGNAKLTLELFFDSSREGDDVRTETQKIWDMMLINRSSSSYNERTKKGEPPKVQFQWGNMSSFTGVIEDIQQKFVLFKPDGTPVRAILTVSFQQFGDENYVPRQNPTSEGMAGYRVRAVVPGDTIDMIAYQEYGDPTKWRRLAEANNLIDPLNLSAGTFLAVPPR